MIYFEKVQSYEHWLESLATLEVSPGWTSIMRAAGIQLPD